MSGAIWRRDQDTEQEVLLRSSFVKNIDRKIATISLWLSGSLCDMARPSGLCCLRGVRWIIATMRLFVVAFMLVHIFYVNNALARPSMTGQAVTNVGDVGEHYPLFLIEKSHHPENITVVYTKLDMHCRVIPHREHGLLPTQLLLADGCNTL